MARANPGTNSGDTILNSNQQMHQINC